MKKYFLIGLIIAIAPNFCFGAGARYTQLVREKQRKMEELEKCMGATKGLKIAGLSTIGLTAVGVAGNIAEAKKRDDLAVSIESADKKLPELDKQIAEQKANQIPQPNVNNVNYVWNPSDTSTTGTVQILDTSTDQYQSNCEDSGGRISPVGDCWCPGNQDADSTGKCPDDQVEENYVQTGLYEQNCIKNGGRINYKGTCICQDDSGANISGECLSE